MRSAGFYLPSYTKLEDFLTRENVIVTGPPRAGKTTAIRSVISARASNSHGGRELLVFSLPADVSDSALLLKYTNQLESLMRSGERLMVG